MFENATNYTKQGDIGEARAIYEYTKLGFGVCRTLFDSMKYDLVVDIDGVLHKVQVKTTRCKSRHGNYTANLKVCGGNSSGNKITNRVDSDYDILFVLAEDGSCWSIPVSEFDAKTAINLGEKYKKFKL